MGTLPRSGLSPRDSRVWTSREAKWGVILMSTLEATGHQGEHSTTPRHYQCLVQLALLCM
eukprot:3871385-Amphidinium_carterae.1